MSELILVNQSGGVCEICLNRPQKRNAITLAMYTALSAALRAAQADDAVGVVLLRAEGPGFSAGNDLQDFLAAGELTAVHPAMDFMRTLATYDKVLMAAVQGKAVGIGVTLLLHCDLVLAARDASFSLPFVSLGLVPELGSTLLLPRLVGAQRAAHMLLLAQPFDAPRAQELGLVTQVTEAGELLAAARACAQALAAQPRESLLATRRLLRGDPREPLARIAEEARVFSALLRTEAFRERVQAFLARGAAKA
ncbi:MAG: enoyl-CoA hydratase/isomerase family protein [Proteobacteria bacterium]|nr:enoyl-CoA hydratase/isomerase family protein [Pseudomonadota bacterium]